MIELPVLLLLQTASKNLEHDSVSRPAHLLDRLEKKVVLNTACLISNTDTYSDCVSKLSTCMVEAIGLKVDFDSLLN